MVKMKQNRWRVAGLLIAAGALAASPLKMGSDVRMAGADGEYAELTAQVN